VRHLLVWDGKCLHRTAGDDGGRQGTAENIGKHRKTAEDGGRRRGTTGDDTMSSVLVLGSYLSGKFWKRRDGTTKCRPFSSWPRTDGLPRCEHWRAALTMYHWGARQIGRANNNNNNKRRMREMQGGIFSSAGGILVIS